MAGNNHSRSDLLLFVHLTICGAVLCAIAAGLCGFSQNDGVIPVAKNLWSLSFVLVMAGTGFWFLALAHQLIDLRQWWNGMPFVAMGKNRFDCYFFGSSLLAAWLI